MTLICPFCDKEIESADIMIVKEKRTIKRLGLREEDFPSVKFLEYGCPHCGGIFFDPAETYDRIISKKLKI